MAPHRSRRSGPATSRRSLFGDQTNISMSLNSPLQGAIPMKEEPNTSVNDSKVFTSRRQSNSMIGLTREERQARAATEEAKRLIGSLDHVAPANSTPPTYNVQVLLRSFATRRSTRQSLTSANHPPSSDDSAGSSSNGTATSSHYDPLEVEWSVFQDWPEGLEREEKEMKQYYKYLKFIHLEQETKIRFITEIVDDLEADPPREAVVYSARDVKERENEMYAAKSQLKQAKQIVRGLRAEVDALSERVSLPYQQLASDCAEAKALLDECMDLELELGKLKSESHGGSMAADLDVENMDLEILPAVGTLTEREAIRFCERQEEALIQLEDDNAQIDILTSRLKADTKTAIKAVDRLASERHGAERAAREAKEMGVGGRKRDKEVERVCLNHSATLALLRSLFGLRRIQALSDTSINLVWLSDRRDGCELSLILNFDQAGGKLVDVELRHPTQAAVILPPPPHPSKSNGRKESLQPAPEAAVEFGPLMQAIRANDVPVVVLEAWEWVERVVAGVVDGAAAVV